MQMSYVGKMGYVLLLLLTSLLTELLGQSVFENDLSSMCCCGSERERNMKREREREYI